MADKTEKTVILLNTKTGDTEAVPISKVGEAIDSGQYQSVGGVATQSEAGDFVRDPEELRGLQQVGEVVDEQATAQAGANRFARERQELVDEDLSGVQGAMNRGMTFADGVADAFTFGFVDLRERKDWTAGAASLALAIQNDLARGGTGYEIFAKGSPGGINDYASGIREDKFSGTYTAGQVAGTIASMAIPGGPAARLTAMGEKAGAAAVKAVLKKATKDSVISRAAGEAVTGALLGGAHGFGTQVRGAVFDDQPFVAEAILDEVGINALMGAGFGAVGGAAGKITGRARRLDVIRQNGLLDINSSISKDVHRSIDEAVRTLDDVVAENSLKAGILGELEKTGHVTPQWLTDAKAQLKKVRAAAKKLGSVKADFAGLTKESIAWRDAMEDYMEAATALDDSINSVVNLEAIRRKGMAYNGNSLEAQARFQNNVKREAGDQFVIKDGPNKGMVDVDSWMAHERLKRGTPQESLDQLGMSNMGNRPGQVLKDENFRLQHGLGTEEEARALAQQGHYNIFGRQVAGEMDWMEMPTPRPGSEGAHTLIGRAADDVTPTVGSDYTDGARVGRRTSIPAHLRERMVGLNPRLQGHGETLMGFEHGPRAVPSPEQNARAFAEFQAMKADQAVDAASAPRGGGTERLTGVGTAEMTAEEMAEEAIPEVGRGGDTGVGSQRAGQRVNRDVSGVDPDKYYPTGIRKLSPKEEAKQAIDNLILDWDLQTKKNNWAPRPRPADIGAARIGELMEQIKQYTGGKLDAAGAVDLVTNSGFKPARTQLGSQIDQLLAVRELGNAVAKASQGGKTAAQKSGKNWMLKWLGNRIGYKVGIGAAGWALGGPLGALMGTMFVDKVLGTTGRAAGSAGRMAVKLSAAADGLLKKGRGIKAARAITLGVNKPVAYSEAGPIEDPVERINEIRRLAQHPEYVYAHVNKQLGDMATFQPDLAKHIGDLAHHRIVQLSLRAPAIYWDKMGNPMPPAAQALRRFLSFENASHDLSGILRDLEAGGATNDQLDALRVQFPAAHRMLLQTVLQKPDALKDLPHTRLKMLERLTQLPLTSSTDPMFVARQMQAWQVQTPPQPQLGNGAPPAPSQTPAQAGARAPGNE